MLKIDKQKDAKNKEKIDLTKSVQNIAYMVSPLNKQSQSSISDLIKRHEIQKIDTIYETEMDTQTKRLFLKTPFNSHKNKDSAVISYRSPYCHKYFPSVTNEEVFLSPFVRNIQEKGFILFNQYAKLYYGQCIANFFVEENQQELCFAFYVQKRIQQPDCSGIWNSSNLANISGDPSKSITYKITTSVIYQLSCPLDNDQSKPFTISGNLKRTKNESRKLTPQIQLDELHLTIIGKAIQQNESYLRQQMQSIFALKTKEIIHKTRIAQTKDGVEEKRKILKQLIEQKAVKKQTSILIQ